MELRYCEECGDLIRDESSRPAQIEDHFVCDRCSKDGGPPTKAAQKAASERAGKTGLAEAESLNLFSNQTIAIRKQKVKAPAKARVPTPELGGEVQKSGRLRLVKAGEEPSPAPQPALEEGSASTARGATKLAFKCIHCKSTLAIRPVAQTSKLICPECGQAIYVTTSGRLLKSSPSTVLRKEGAPERTPGGSASMRPGTSQMSAPSGGSLRQGSVRQRSLKQGSVFARVGGGSAAVRAQSSTAVSEASPTPGPSRDAGEPQRSTRNAATTKPPSVRLSSSNPREDGLQSKPSSAFEEHRTDEDPEKTIFITEEPETDLRDIRVPEAIQAPPPAAREQRRQKSVRVVPAQKADPLHTYDSDLLDEESDMVTIPAGGFDRKEERQPLPLRKDLPRAAATPVKSQQRRPGIAKRAFKALFSP